MPLGVYISIPFCRTKCSYCNFASDVFSRAVFEQYVTRVCADIQKLTDLACTIGGCITPSVDCIYLGGGTPTVLESAQSQRLFVAVRQNFEVLPGAEITVECAPGTLSDVMLEVLIHCGVNRVSLGVQSFVDEEARAVGRLHQRSTVIDDVTRLRRAGLTNINIDLIAGLPHQTLDSWNFSLEQLIAVGAPHASIYMLEVDEDSRLGREVMAGGTKYHAHFVPDDDAIADFYEVACAKLESAGIRQYEISNFAREGRESKHNLKYWTRQPYVGFGVDAHSMLHAVGDSRTAVRLSTPDSLERYVAGASPSAIRVDETAALEEEFFLGLRLNRGVDIALLEAKHRALPAESFATIRELVDEQLLEQVGGVIRLSPRGRLVSNDVFERFLLSSTLPS